jgi:IMP dehydrogenase
MEPKRQLYHEVLETASRQGIGLSYDDVLIVPKKSNVAPTEPDTTGAFSKNIKLKVPLVSASMDTVTEEKMAKKMALCGGLGVIHRNLTPEDQAEMVRSVKRSGYIIRNPVTVRPDCTIDNAYKLASKYGFQTFPVLREGESPGIVTGKDLRLGKAAGEKLVEDVMTADPVYTLVGTPKKEAIRIMKEKKVEKLIVLDEKGGLYGLTTLRDIMAESEYPDATRDSEGRLLVAAAVGVVPGDEKRIKMLYEAGVDALVVDSSHGYCDDVIRTIKWIKEQYKDGRNVDVVAGNVVTGEGAVELAKAGADGIKVGIGVGRTCITRNMTGVGKPQLSAIYDTRKALTAAGYSEIPVIADGGLKEPADHTKSHGAGAHSGMVGSMFAGTEESPGEEIIQQGRMWKKVRGMGSQGAQQERQKLSENYKEAEFGREGYNYRVPEGVEGLVPFAGPVEKLIQIYMGGLMSSMAHVGAKNLDEYQKKVSFIRITPAGRAEGKSIPVILDEPMTGLR